MLLFFLFLLKKQRKSYRLALGYVKTEGPQQEQTNGVHW